MNALFLFAVCAVSALTSDVQQSAVEGGHVLGHSGPYDGLVRFNDSDSWNHGRISAIRMQCGQYLLALQVQYNLVWAPMHGFWNDKCSTNQSWTHTYYFGEDEWIERAELTGGRYASSITLTTNKRRLETCGIPAVSPRFVESGRLEYVSGIFGCYFEQFRLHWSSYQDVQQSAVEGGHVLGHSGPYNGLVRFNDSASWNHGRISALKMQCGQYLLALQVQYNGVWASKHGFWNSKCSTNQSWTPTYYFGEDEWIVRAELTGGRYASSITLTTNKRRLETCGIPAVSHRFVESGRLEYVSGIFGCYFDQFRLHWSSYQDEAIGGHVLGRSGPHKGLVRFNDSASWNHGRISALKMQCGQYLLALQVQYNGVWASKHGFWNNNCSTNQSWTPTYYFGEDEWIERAELTGGRYASSITLTTNKRRLETCGIPAVSPRFVESGRLEYVTGVFGCYFDRFQLYWSSYVSP